MVEVGERAPDFELLDTDLKVRRLSDFLGKDRLVVILTFPARLAQCALRSCARLGIT